VRLASPGKEVIVAKRSTQRARRRQPSSLRDTGSGYSLGSLTNLGAIPLLTAVFSVAGFYYVTNGTLSRHGDDIIQIKTKVESSVAEDNAARNKIRDEFLASQTKTAEGIGKLDLRLAVAETNQKTANETLSKIADSLNRITATIPSAFTGSTRSGK